MNPKLDVRYDAFKEKLRDITKSEAVAELKEEIIKDVFMTARKVALEYDPDISIQKAQKGSLEGAITAFVSLLIFGAVKLCLNNVSEGAGDTISASAGIIAGGIVHGLQKWFFNRKKHK